MLIISTVPQAIGLMIAGVFLLGTWPAVWNLIEQRGRIPSHIFLDYAITYLVVSTVVALTLGQLGPAHPAAAAAAVGDHNSSALSMNFLDQLHQPNSKLIAFAVAGGFCLALGDLGMQYSTAMLGLSIGPPVLNALTVIIGVVLSYFLDGGINKPQLVFPGMACAALAITAGAAAHLISQRSSRTRQQQLQGHDAASHNSSSEVSHQHDSAHSTHATATARHSSMMRSASSSPSTCDQADHDEAQSKAVDCVVDLPDCNSCSDQQQPVPPNARTAAVNATEKLERQRSIQAGGNSRFLGLAIAIIGGIIYSLFLPAFQIAATDPFGLQPADVPPLSVYTANFYFSTGFTALSIAINVAFLYRPPLGTASSTLWGYVRDHDGRALSILSGVLASLGDLTQFIGGQTAGYAACMLVMAYPVVGVLWGLVRFKEFKQGSKISNMMVVCQVLCYATAVGLLAGSAELRHHHMKSSS